MGRNEFEQPKQLPVEQATESLSEVMLEETHGACKGFAKMIFEKGIVQFSIFMLCESYLRFTEKYMRKYISLVEGAIQDFGKQRAHTEFRRPSFLCVSRCISKI